MDAKKKIIKEYKPQPKGGIVLSLVIIFGFISLISAAIGNMSLNAIKKNWGKYKCKPYIIPLAGLFGHDAMTTFSDCIHGSLGDAMEKLTSGINLNLSTITSAATGMGSSVGDLASTTGGMKTGFLGGITDIFSKIELLLLKLKFLMTKIQGMGGLFLGMGSAAGGIIENTPNTITAVWNDPAANVIKTFANI